LGAGVTETIRDNAWFGIEDYFFVRAWTLAAPIAMDPLTLAIARMLVFGQTAYISGSRGRSTAMASVAMRINPW